MNVSVAMGDGADEGVAHDRQARFRPTGTDGAGAVFTHESSIDLDEHGAQGAD